MVVALDIIIWVHEALPGEQKMATGIAVGLVRGRRGGRGHYDVTQEDIIWCSSHLL